MTRVVLFTGSRDYHQRDLVETVLSGLVNEANRCGDDLVLVHGHNPRGLDSFVHALFEERFDLPWVTEQPCPAAWEHCVPECPPTSTHRKARMVPRSVEATEPPGAGLVEETYCPTAGLRRNQEMLDLWHPHLCLAFVSKPLHLSRGTDDMVRRATAAHVPTHVISPGGTHR